jgi:pilus assembly protein Flp/PilA
MYTVTFAVLQGVFATRMWLQERVGSERGAAAVEYGLLVGLIAAVIVGVVAVFGTGLENIFSNTSNAVCKGANAAATGGCVKGG